MEALACCRANRLSPPKAINSIATHAIKAISRVDIFIFRIKKINPCE
jgi:hypothetical protein